VKYHLTHLVADLLRVVNEVARLSSAHYSNALPFEHCDDRFGISARGIVLFTCNRSK